MESTKLIHTLVLDTGAIIKNEPPVSTLLSKAEILITVPEILGEIKDAATRARVQTTLLPFLQLRSPGPSSVKFVVDFARRTGDLAVLSKADLQIVALGYEIECERNGGDWRLRRAPGQKRVNGAPPVKVAGAEQGSGANEPIDGKVPDGAEASPVSGEQVIGESQLTDAKVLNGAEAPPFTSGQASGVPAAPVQMPEQGQEPPSAHAEGASGQEEQTSTRDAAYETDIPEAISQLAEATLSDRRDDARTSKVDSAQNSADGQESSSDSEGWITPSNLKKRQAQDAGASSTPADEQKTMQVAILTTDFAMQNVILQTNLNLLSPSLTRVKHLKTFVLRCHACFQVTKEMGKQFCPRCGQPALTRVSCSTSASGEFKLHLKKNMQWNHRGERYSVPKPVHGSANGKLKGGGKGGWGNDLMLAEDQKEYQRATWEEKKTKERSLMDEDYLPSILTGDRNRAGGRVRVGAGRNVNSRKR